MDIRDMLIEMSTNTIVLNRNSTILNEPMPGNDYDTVTKKLCFSPGMVRFIYTDWSNVTRMIEGHVCDVIHEAVSKNVKLWTEKNEMVMIGLSFGKNVTVVQLPSSYTSKVDNHEF